MKHKVTIMAALAGLFGAPPGYRTANTAEAAAPIPTEKSDTSMIGMLCKGAGVDPEDVRWRIAAGLDAKQAVDAALSQKEEDARNGKSKKGGK